MTKGEDLDPNNDYVITSDRDETKNAGGASSVAYSPTTSEQAKGKNCPAQGDRAC